MSLISHLRHTIATVGSHLDLPDWERKYVARANLLGAALAVLCIPYVALFWLTAGWRVGVGAIVTSVLYASTLFFNGRGHTAIGRSVPVLVGNAAIFGIAGAMGVEADVQTFFFLMVAFPFLLFHPGEVRKIMGLVTVPMAGFLLVGFEPVEALRQVTLSDEVVPYVAACSSAMTYGLLSITLFVFYSANTRNEESLFTLVERLSGEIESRRRMEDALRASTAEAEAATRAKAQFLATMSHEIRTPMNGVIGMTSLLAQTRLDPDQREMASVIRSSGEFLLMIINDILDFSKIDAGRMELEHAPFDLVELVEEAVEALAPKVTARGIDITIDIRPGVPRFAVGDPNRLRQILTNLTGNAIKFTEEGYIQVRLETISRREGAFRLRCEVADTGIGISEEGRERLFQAFSQSDSSMSRRYGGTGLGLAICQRLVALMDGTIGVESTPGEGSTFWFEIALSGDATPWDAQRPLEGHGAIAVSPVSAVAHSLADTLCAMGMAAMATDSLSALAVSAASLRPNVVLADRRLLAGAPPRTWWPLSPRPPGSRTTPSSW